MPTRPPVHPAPGSPHARERTRWTTKPRRIYGRKQHRSRRERLLAEEPNCRPCAQAGRIVAAVIRDHIVALEDAYGYRMVARHGTIDHAVATELILDYARLATDHPLDDPVGSN